tara:strand:+ start:945 stop:1373 length:429 start_codon:yes stop_codon:yes gene_type:complete
MSDIENVGKSGDVITVKPGFARNMLIPKGLALRASKRNLAVSKENKRVVQAKLKRENQAIELLAKKLSKVEITIEVKVGEEEKMFGSITNKDIHNELINKGFELKRNQISINEPIKALGIYHINVKVSKDITSDVKLYVIKG